MTVNYTDFDVVAFYSYPCSVVDRITEYEEDGFHGTRGDVNIKKLFHDCLGVAEHKLNKRLMDNKIALKIRHKDYGTEFYIGYKDGIYSLGLAMHPFMNSAYTVEFNNDND